MSINIFGVVGEDVRASDVLKQIQAEKGDSIEVTIMSCGGSVIEGLAIYDALRAASNNGQKIKTSALGMAASIASVIFMAGDVREVSDNAEIMVHNASVVTGGNKHTLKDAIETLDGMDSKLIDIYTARTELSVEEVTDLLNQETFMSADEAISKGFATAKADALALVAIHNKQKEPVNMAKEEEEVKGFVNKLMAFFKEEAKAEDVKAEDDIPEKEDDAAEEAKAEDEPMEEKPDFEAENVALKAEIEALKASAQESDEGVEAKAEEVEEEKKEEEAKAILVFTAMTDDKVNMKEAKNLLSKSLSFVNETLKDRQANHTGLGKSEAPKEEPKNTIYSEYKAISDPAERQAFFAKNKTEIINQSKES